MKTMTFPLIKLAKKLKDDPKLMRLVLAMQFPLIKLAKKLKVGGKPEVKNIRQSFH
jgi:hypothetical protein